MYVFCTADECDIDRMGPHEMVCLRKWWEREGCMLDGTESPDNNPDNVDRWNQQNSQDVKTEMKTFFQNAADGQNSSIPHQNIFQCFGKYNVFDLLT